MKPITVFLSLIVFIGTAGAVLSGNYILKTDAAGTMPAQTKALWVFGGSVVPNPVSAAAGRSRLVETSSAEGIDTLYVSTYRPTQSSTFRFMYEDADMAALNAAAHARGQEVWAAYGDSNWPTFGCTGADFPVRRMQEVVNYNNAVAPNERFDGVMLDVEPGAAFNVASYIALHQCLRSVLPPSIKLGTAISAFWEDPVAYPAGGIVKPEFAHVIDLPLDKVVVMGYRDTAGTAVCLAGDGLICLDQAEIAYASSIGKAGLVLVGLETMNVSPGQPEKVSFFEEGSGAIVSESATAAAHFSAASGFGGFSIHNFSASYLGGAAGWPVPSVVGSCSTGSNVDVEATSGTASTGYSTLKQAFDAINAGTHSGTINIEICANTNEGTNSAVLNSSGAGSASYGSIHLYPLGGARTVSGASAAGRGLIELNGADNVTIDGDDPLSPGTNRDLTLQNTGAATDTHVSVVRIALNSTSVATADNCVLKNLVIIGNATGRNIGTLNGTGTSANVSYGVYAGGGASGATSAPASGSAVAAAGGASASNLTVQNNSVNSTARGIAVNGSAANVFAGLLVTNNQIGNPTAGAEDQVYSMGITVQGSSNASVSGNTVYVESYLTTGLRGIDFGSMSAAGSGASFEKNRVLRVRNNNPQTRGAYGINLNGGNNHIVFNNFVADIRIDQTSGQNVFTPADGAIGIRVGIGTGHEVLHNSVNLFGSVPGTLGSTLTASLAVSVPGNSGLDIRNNIFSNQLTGGNPTGIIHAAVYLPSGANSSMDVLWNNNAYFQGGGPRNRLAQVGTSLGSGEYTAANFNPVSTSPAANFRSYTNGLNQDGTNDNASFAVAAGPPFTSDIDLHVSGSTPLESGGANAGVGSDIDGDSRNASSPDIGADEFNGVAANQPPSITSTAPISATEDVLLTYNATSTDADGPASTWSLLPAHSCGGSIGGATGVFSFTPSGPVPPASCNLGIQVCDGGSPNLCASQSSTVNIAAVNDPPVITSSAPTTATEDTLYTYNAAFSDPDGTGSAWAIVPPTHTCGGGIDAAGQFTFTPAGPTPPASCVVAIRVCDDASACSAVQSTTVTISAVDDSPIAVDDSLSTTRNVPLVVSGASLASNDTDPELAALTVTAVSNPVNGSVNLSAGSVTFTPTNGFTGTAGFDYTVSDGTLTDTGHVSVTVTPPAFSGLVSVGTGEAITSLTNDGGLFEQMNIGTINANTTVNITTDLSTETGTHALNQLTETGAGGYTIVFQASGGARVISGSNSTALITLNGADRVTFSGTALGPGGLTFRNTGIGATIRYINDASFNSLVGCVVEGGTDSNISGVVFIGAGPTTGNDNISITDSVIRDRSDAAGVPVNLVLVDGSGGEANSNIVVSNNQIFNYTQSGVSFLGAENVTATLNTIYQASARTTPLFAVQVVASLGSNLVSQNIIRDHTTTSAFVGLNLQDNAGTMTANRNRIYNIDNSTGSVVPFNGVQVTGSVSASSVSLVNNMISITPATASSQLVTGVLDSRTSGTMEMNFNSVYLGGPAVSDSWAFRRLSGSTASVSLIGNLLFNGRTGAANHFAIGDQSGGGGSWSSDYNLFVGMGSTVANFFDYNGGAVDFAAWKPGPPARDANSIAGTRGDGPFNLGNIFVSAADLHLRTNGNNPAINRGTDTGLNIDFDGQNRPFNGIPDIGADEVQTAPTAAEASIAGRVVTPEGRGIRNVRVTVTGGHLTEPLMSVTSSFGYYRVEGLRAGETYVVSVGGKRYRFETQSRLVSLGEDALDVDFVGERR